MHTVNTNNAPNIFLEKLSKPCHLYNTRFSQINFTKPRNKLKRSRFRVSIRGPYIWNDFLTKKEKEIESISSFKIAVKSKLLLLNKELVYF